MLLQSCGSTDPSLTLDIPKEGFEVVQYIPVESDGRDTNALYLAPRRIKDDEFNTAELNVYIDSMYAMMLRKSGVGIASNQLGKRLQIFIIEAKSSNPRYKVLGPVAKQVFINPKITKTSKERKNFWHGCLSAHGEKRGNVATYEWIEYECQNQKGEIQQGRLEGFASVIFQHEFRHMLNGTYLDHANHFLSRGELDAKLDAEELPFFDLANDTLPLLIEGYVVGETLDEFHSHKK
ncbi:MAG: peptide deformylase [Aureispira sp.]|nr:peptide deformylase [Aureispira sp.]